MTTLPISIRASLLGLALLAGAGGAAAQGTLVDEGTFQVVISGREAGTEEFSIRQRGTGTSADVSAVGRVKVELPSGTLDLQPRLRGTGLQANPVAYEVSVGGDSPHTLAGTLAGGRFSARIASPTGERLREYVVSRGAAILDDGVAHHYYFLAQRTRGGSIPVIVPRENRQVMATVTDRGEERVEIAGTTLTLSHLTIEPMGSGVRHVWVDALNRVMKVHIPDIGYTATRTAVPS